jgi:hypothetical protein
MNHHDEPNHSPQIEQQQYSIYEASYQYCCRHAVTRFLDEHLQSNSTVETPCHVVVVDSIHDKDVVSESLEKNNESTTVNGSCSKLVINDGDAVKRNVDLTHLESFEQSPPLLVDILEDWNGTFHFDQTNDHFLCRPCLIRNCTLLQQCFQFPRQFWLKYSHPQQQQKHQRNDVSRIENDVTDSLKDQLEKEDDNKTPIGINRQWFVEVCDDILVPVYWNDLSFHVATGSDTSVIRTDTKLDVLDNEGRANELPIRYMTIQQYINDCLHNNTNYNCNSEFTNRSIPYLKDWHFQLWYEQQKVIYQGTLSPAPQFNYTLPKYLPYDLLNGFLLQFDPNSNHHGTNITSTATSMSTTTAINNYNDYRFVYWGPSRSNTTIHTDVLLSLSWSYNIYGTKLWTFYIPTTANTIDDESESFRETVVTIQQQTGELMLVPSGIKHSVINQQETLSINHNWITADILSNVWHCIRSELLAVDNELLSWQSNWSVTCYDARESMLRGCVGLNVSLYFFMILTRGLDLLQYSIKLNLNNVWSHSCDCIDRSIRQDVMFISNSLQEICNDPLIHLRERLGATLHDIRLSDQALRIAMHYIQFISNI